MGQNLEQRTALFRGFKRLQNFALDPSCHYENIESLNKYINPEDGKKTTAYAGQIVSVYGQPKHNGIYMVIPGETGLELSEKLATESQVNDLIEKINTAILNMVIANPKEDPEKPTEYHALDTVKIADKTYKLVKAAVVEETETGDKNLYAIEIGGITYNLKTNLDGYVSKDELDSILAEGVVGRVDKIEEVLGLLIDLDNDPESLESIQDIINELKKLEDEDFLNIIERITKAEKNITGLDTRVTTNTTEIGRVESDANAAIGVTNTNLDQTNKDIAAIRQNINTVTTSVSAVDKKIDDQIGLVTGRINDHIKNLYSVKRIREITVSGPVINPLWVTADSEEWCSTGDIIEQVSVTIDKVPENFTDVENLYEFKFFVNGDVLVDSDDIIFDDLGTTFEFSFNTKLMSNLNAAAFSIALPEGATLTVIATYIILQK